MIDIPQHEAEVAGFGYRRRQWCVWLEKLKASGEFTGSEARLVEALAPGGAPIEHVEMLGLAVLGTRARRHLEVRLDYVSDVYKNGRRSLLAIFIDDNVQSFEAASIH